MILLRSKSLNFFLFQLILNLHKIFAKHRGCDNTIIEYCSEGKPGEDKLCRDAEFKTDFHDKRLRITGAFITYDKGKTYENITFGYGQCIDRPQGSYIKLLPWACWQRYPQIPFLIIISESMDILTVFGDENAQIPLSEGKTHIMVFNGELRSFRNDVRKRCVLPKPDLRGVSHYHFVDKKRGGGGGQLKNYDLTKKDKLYLGSSEMEECKKLPKSNPNADIFYSKTEKNLVPLKHQWCELACQRSDLSILRARNGSDLPMVVSDDATLPGILIHYALNASYLMGANNVFSPNVNDMETVLYDTEVLPGQGKKREEIEDIGPVPVQPQPQNIQNSLGTEVGEESGVEKQPLSSGNSQNGHVFDDYPDVILVGNSKRKRSDPAIYDLLLESFPKETTSQQLKYNLRRQKRLTFSSAKRRANAVRNADDSEDRTKITESLKCVY